MRPRRDDTIMVLQRSVDSGEIQAGVDLEVTVHALFGSLISGHILGAPMSRKRIEETVDTIWRGLATSRKR